jgi:beta-N-acetylhexosaminidase
MCLDDLVAFPNLLTPGAIPDSYLVPQMGLVVGRQLKIFGVNMNFSKVIDVNSNPKSTVINFHSFGESSENVSIKRYCLY